MHDRTGDRTGDAGHELHVADDHFTQLVDAARLGEHDHVVRTRHRVYPYHSGDVANRRGHVTCPPDLGLHEDVRLDHDTSPSPPPGTACRRNYRTRRARMG